MLTFRRASRTPLRFAEPDEWGGWRTLLALADAAEPDAINGIAGLAQAALPPQLIDAIRKGERRNALRMLDALLILHRQLLVAEMTAHGQRLAQRVYDLAAADLPAPRQFAEPGQWESADAQRLAAIAARLRAAGHQTLADAITALEGQYPTPPGGLWEALTLAERVAVGNFSQAIDREPGGWLTGLFQARGVAQPAQSGMTLRGAFVLRNPETRAWLDQMAASLVVADPAQQALIRQTLVDGLDAGVNPDEIIDRLKTQVALDARRAGALDRYRDHLAQDPDRDPEIAKGLVERYRNRLLRDRAKVIARTELLSAENAGQQALWGTALRSDLIDPEDTVKRWIVTPDDRLCDHTCAPMARQEVGVEDEFETPGGKKVAHPPAHPQCRCAMRLVFGKAPARPKVEVAPVTDRKAPIRHPGVTDAWADAVGPINRRFMDSAFGDEAADLWANADRAIKDFVGASEVFVRVTPDSLAGILTDGRFKTQFETGTSGAGYEPKVRRQFERDVLDVPENTPNAKRPVYGYLTPNRNGLHGDEYGLAQYGDVAVALKPTVRKRSTFTVNDSLDHAGWLSVYFNDEQAKGRRTQFTLHFPGAVPMPVEKPSAWAVRPDRPYDSRQAINNDSRYVEAQIRDGVGVADIDRVVFGSPPDAAMIERLRRLAIPWEVRQG